MKLSILAVLLLAFAAKEVASQACHMREIDLCTAIGMFQFQSNGVPSNEEELDEFCEAMREVTDCMRNYSSKCMSPLQREIADLFSGADEQAVKLCTPGAEARARYLKHSDCISINAESEGFTEKVKDLQVAIETMFKQPFYSRIPTICCGFRRFEIDMDKAAEEKCGKDAAEMVVQLRNSILTEMPNIICRPFDPEGSECKSILPERGTPPKGADGSDSHLLRLMDTVFSSM